MDHVLDRPHQTRREAIAGVMKGMGADAALYLMAVRGSDQLVRAHGCRGVSEPAAATARWRLGDGVAIVLSDPDPDHIAPVNLFASPPPDLDTLPFFRWFIVEVGYRSILFTNITIGAEHRGFVALLRAEPGPWAVDRSTRASAARVVGAAFRRAWEEEVALAPPAGTLDVEHSGRLSGDCAVVAWAERVEFASWLAPRVELAAAGVSSSPFGPQTMQPAPASFMRVLLREEGGPTCSFEPVVPMVLPSLLLALSPALKRVASLAAAGATVPEIARATDRSPETVKESLGKIYQRLGVSSRAELVSLARRVLL